MRYTGSRRRSSTTLFERLIAISGVGPKLALAVLSGIEPAELIRAVRAQDVARLTQIPGVGKKTAERIGLELKDRLPTPSTDQRPSPLRRRRPRIELRSDLLSALLNLGYQRAGGREGHRPGDSQTLADVRRFEQALKADAARLLD